MTCMISRVDPHAHTSHSDGTVSPRDLVRAAANSGVDMVGITDHDTVSGWGEAAEAAADYGVGLLRGAEVSAAFGPHSVHILGFLMDPSDPVLTQVFSDARKSRERRLKQMATNLRADYPRLEWEAVVASAAGAPLGRPHLADQLVAAGYFPDRSSAFQWALSPAGPYYVSQKMIGPVEAVTMIRAAGGVPVLAHPFSVTRGWAVPDDLVAEMVEAGLFGIERDHRDLDASGREHAQRLADDLGIFVSGGSDYHGAGKPNRLGENLLDLGTLREIEEQGHTELIPTRTVGS